MGCDDHRSNLCFLQSVYGIDQIDAFLAMEPMNVQKACLVTFYVVVLFFSHIVSLYCFCTNPKLVPRYIYIHIQFFTNFFLLDPAWFLTTETSE
jgi:hypothetical protein